MYPVAFIDGDGNTLTGANKYVLHFDKGQTPPANAFWSVTMYDKDGFQVPNPINRFAIGDRDKLTFNPDGSLDIYAKRTRREKTRKQIGFPRRRASFSPPCASIRHVPKCWMVHGHHHPSSA